MNNSKLDIEYQNTDHFTALHLNARIAELKGWINIVEAAGALLGTPPNGAPRSRGQALIPNWTGNWKDCGELMVEFDLYPSMRVVEACEYENEQDKNSHIRRIICLGAIQRLAGTTAIKSIGSLMLDNALS